MLSYHHKKKEDVKCTMYLTFDPKGRYCCKLQVIFLPFTYSAHLSRSFHSYLYWTGMKENKEGGLTVAWLHEYRFFLLEILLFHCLVAVVF
jgi:hypothetical protein